MENSQRFFTLANAFTAIRILLTPVFFYFLTREDDTGKLWALILFAIAALTDFFDGYVARKFGQLTDLGMFLDPLADKVLVLSAFLSFVSIGLIPLWTVSLIILRDIVTTLMRVLADSRNQNLQTSKSAKWKTFFQMLFCFVVLVLEFTTVSWIPENVSMYSNSIIRSLAIKNSMILITIFTLYTMFEYIVANRGLFGKSKA